LEERSQQEYQSFRINPGAIRPSTASRSKKWWRNAAAIRSVTRTI
jgi:hypothetical protein